MSLRKAGLEAAVEKLNKLAEMEETASKLRVAVKDLLKTHLAVEEANYLEDFIDAVALNDYHLLAHDIQDIADRE
jgi:hypothetical protein